MCLFGEDGVFGKSGHVTTRFDTNMIPVSSPANCWIDTGRIPLRGVMAVYFTLIRRWQIKIEITGCPKNFFNYGQYPYCKACVRQEAQCY